MTVSHGHLFRVWVCTSPGEETPHGRCYVSILGRGVAVDGEDPKDAFVSLNALLVFLLVIIVTQSVAPTALPSLVFFSQPSQSSAAGAGHRGNTLQSIFATLWLASSTRWFLLPARDGLVYSTTLCKGCSPQEVQIFPALVLVPSRAVGQPCPATGPAHPLIPPPMGPRLWPRVVPMPEAASPPSHEGPPPPRSLGMNAGNGISLPPRATQGLISPQSQLEKFARCFYFIFIGSSQTVSQRNHVPI